MTNFCLPEYSVYFVTFLDVAEPGCLKFSPFVLEVVNFAEEKEAFCGIKRQISAQALTFDSNRFYPKTWF